jgi:hypothetical protein
MGLEGDQQNGRVLSDRGLELFAGQCDWQLEQAAEQWQELLTD